MNDGLGEAQYLEVVVVLTVSGSAPSDNDGPGEGTVLGCYYRVDIVW
jgi:hypothetical protein